MHACYIIQLQTMCHTLLSYIHLLYIFYFTHVCITCESSALLLNQIIYKYIYIERNIVLLINISQLVFKWCPLIKSEQTIEFVVLF